MTDWNFADTWEVVARVRPDADALVHGDRRLSWAQLARRADGIAAALLGAGLGHQAKVAQYLYNTPEYVESFFAAMKAGMAPVNTNYRYTADELVYLWDNADVEAVVFDHEFTGRVEEIRGRLPKVRLWLVVGPAGGPVEAPPWAVAYESAATAGAGVARPPWGRSGDDLILIYTGGTTGLPKGVMWRQDDLWAILNRTASLRYPEDGGLDDVAARLAAPSKRTPPRLLPGPPLMHGTGMFSAMSALASGGALVLAPSRKFNAVEVLDTVERERVTELVIVGDAFARPLLDALDANPGRWDLSSLWLILSSGVMWSAEVRAGLLRQHPGLMLVDTLGSSEAIGMASSRSSSGAAPSTAGFKLSDHTRVIAAEGHDVVPGSGEMGLVALRGRGSIGYYKDEAKTAATYRLIDGERWSIPGDWATIEADGTVRLLGRGSVCINTGGEKVFPEEVEAALLTHPGVVDAVVVGIPDERFGEQVTAVVVPDPDGGPSTQELMDHVKGRLANFKAPRQVLFTTTLNRAANGKADYAALRARAAAELGAATS